MIGPLLSMKPEVHLTGNSHKSNWLLKTFLLNMEEDGSIDALYVGNKITKRRTASYLNVIFVEPSVVSVPTFHSFGTCMNSSVLGAVKASIPALLVMCR